MIYFDNSATTSLNDKVLKSMMDFLVDNYSNPSSIYEFSQKSRVAIEKARENVANYINANKNEVFFTASGTEANNWAIFGSTIRKGIKKGHVITTEFEHSAVLEPYKYLKNNGFDVTYLKPNSNGFIEKEDLIKNLREDTILVSIMYVNNEVGTIQNIAEFSKLIKENNNKTLFHVDAVQALSELEIDVDKLNIDLLTLSAHKVHGPKGVGALYIRSGREVENLILGGSQERQRRAGTENVSGIVGFSKAIDLLRENRNDNVISRKKLMDYLINKINENFSDYIINGSLENRHSGILNIAFLGMEKDMLLMNLDFKGICISSGSACSSGSSENSHVLKSMNIDDNVSSHSIRISLGEQNTFEEIDFFIDVLKEIL